MLNPPINGSITSPVLLYSKQLDILLGSALLARLSVGLSSPQLHHFMSQYHPLQPYSVPSPDAYPTAQKLTPNEDLLMEARERKSNNLRNMMRIGKRHDTWAVNLFLA
uniref:Uncharacterized protein n=1 Tax=Ditylenchus dipsaci TaxID=166011 RepID=A0A915E4V5_9BILA